MLWGVGLALLFLLAPQAAELQDSGAWLDPGVKPQAVGSGRLVELLRMSTQSEGSGFAVGRRRSKRSVFLHSGVRICPQETINEVLASHQAYYQLRVCQEAVWEAFRIFFDRIPGTAEYQKWVHTCQHESLCISDLAKNFSSSEEHMSMVQRRMNRRKDGRPPTRRVVTPAPTLKIPEITGAAPQTVGPSTGPPTTTTTTVVLLLSPASASPTPSPNLTPPAEEVEEVKETEEVEEVEETEEVEDVEEAEEVEEVEEAEEVEEVEETEEVEDVEEAEEVEEVEETEEVEEVEEAEEVEEVEEAEEVEEVEETEEVEDVEEAEEVEEVEETEEVEEVEEAEEVEEVEDTEEVEDVEEAEEDSELPNVVPESPVQQIVEFSIDLVDPGYRELLDDPDSPQYFDLAQHLQDQMQHVFDKLPGFKGIKVLEIRQTETQDTDGPGGITVHYSLSFEMNSPKINSENSETATGAPESSGNTGLRDMVTKALREEASLPIDMNSLNFEPEAVLLPALTPTSSVEVMNESSEPDSHNEFDVSTEEPEADKPHLVVPLTPLEKENALVTLLDPTAVPDDETTAVTGGVMDSSDHSPASEDITDESEAIHVSEPEPSNAEREEEEEALIITHEIETIHHRETGELVRDYIPTPPAIPVLETDAPYLSLSPNLISEEDLAPVDEGSEDLSVDVGVVTPTTQILLTTALAGEDLSDLGLPITTLSGVTGQPPTEPIVNRQEEEEANALPDEEEAELGVADPYDPSSETEVELLEPEGELELGPDEELQPTPEQIEVSSPEEGTLEVSEPEIETSEVPEPEEGVVVEVYEPEEGVVEVSEPEEEVVEVSETEKGVVKVSEAEEGIVEVSETEKGVVEVSEPEEGVVEVSGPEEGVVEVLGPEEGVVEVSETEKGVVEVLGPEEGVVEVSEPEERVVEVSGPEEGVVEVSEPEEGVVEVSGPEEGVVEVSEPEEGVVEVSGPEEGVVEVSEPEKGVVEVSVPEEEVVEVTEPEEGVVEVSGPEEGVFEVSGPEEGVVEVSRPEEGVVEVSRPEEEVVEVSGPEEGVVEVSEPEEGVVEVSGPEEGVVEVSEPEEGVVEVSGPEEGVVEVSEPEKGVVEVSVPEEEVVEVTEPEEGVVEVSGPEEGVFEVSGPEEGVVEVSRPEEGVVEVSRPEEEVVEVSGPEEGVVEVTEPEEGVVEVSGPEEGVVEVSRPEEEVVEVSGPEEGVVEVSRPEEGVVEVSGPEEGVVEVSGPEEGVVEVSEPEGELVVENQEPGELDNSLDEILLPEQEIVEVTEEEPEQSIFEVSHPGPEPEEESEPAGSEVTAPEAEVVDEEAVDAVKPVEEEVVEVPEPEDEIVKPDEEVSEIEEVAPAQGESVVDVQEPASETELAAEQEVQVIEVIQTRDEVVEDAESEVEQEKVTEPTEAVVEVIKGAPEPDPDQGKQPEEVTDAPQPKENVVEDVKPEEEVVVVLVPEREPGDISEPQLPPKAGEEAADVLEEEEEDVIEHPEETLEPGRGVDHVVPPAEELPEVSEPESEEEIIVDVPKPEGEGDDVPEPHPEEDMVEILEPEPVEDVTEPPAESIKILPPVDGRHLHFGEDTEDEVLQPVRPDVHWPREEGNLPIIPTDIRPSEEDIPEPDLEYPIIIDDFEDAGVVMATETSKTDPQFETTSAVADTAAPRGQDASEGTEDSPEDTQESDSSPERDISVTVAPVSDFFPTPPATPVYVSEVLAQPSPTVDSELFEVAEESVISSGPESSEDDSTEPEAEPEQSEPAVVIIDEDLDEAVQAEGESQTSPPAAAEDVIDEAVKDLAVELDQPDLAATEANELPDEGSGFPPLVEERTAVSVTAPPPVRYLTTPTMTTASHSRELVVFFSLRVTNMKFTEDLFNKTSQEYRSLENTFLDVLLPFLQANLTGFKNLEILNFRKGSVVINSKMKFAKSVPYNITEAVHCALEQFCSAASKDLHIQIDTRSLDIEPADQADACKFMACDKFSRCVVNGRTKEAQCLCEPGFLSVDGLPCQSQCVVQPDYCRGRGECHIVPGHGAVCRYKDGYALPGLAS